MPVQPGSAVLTAPLPTAEARAAAANWTDAARILAGEVPDAGSKLGALENLLGVRRHREIVKTAWEPFETTRLKPAMQFARAEIASQPYAKGPVYYPFSGPDFVNAYALFPDRQTYVFFSLEEPGRAPKLGRLDDERLDQQIGRAHV